MTERTPCNGECCRNPHRVCYHDRDCQHHDRLNHIASERKAWAGPTDIARARNIATARPKDWGRK